jgi:two-component system NtrC family sensor kinase
VLADPGQLEQVLVNLVINARDAMPEGGKLTIETANTCLDEGYAKRNAEVIPGRYVMIAVSDTGVGMSREVAARVFEPFFTTKEVGKGTGLGLSQVYGFARQSGGAASIATSERRGTAVTLFLPRSFEAAAQPRQEIASAAIAPPAGTVLLVEDNAEVAEVGRAYFEQLGYAVRHAPSAQAGIDLLTADAGVDLVFSDILMPGGMNGLQLADMVRRLYPDLTVLLTTGYSSSAQDAVRRGFAVLQKPYDLAALETALRATRGGAGGAPVTERERAVG